MIREKTSFCREELSAFARDFLKEDMLFFDIETTGLSPETDTVYCIGCGYETGEAITVDLCLAETPGEEEAVLRAFRALLRTHSVPVTFNGATFDLPFLRRRAARYGMPDVPGAYETVPAEAVSRGTPSAVDDSLPVRHLDLYREALRMKKLLGLSDYKQKTIERFLGCEREDALSGGELTAVYRKYVAHPEPESLRLLLLHNRDDVRGMFELPNLLSYRQLADGRFTVAEVIEEEDASAPPEERTRDTGDKKNPAGPVSRYLSVKLLPDYPLPRSLRFLSTAADASRGRADDDGSLSPGERDSEDTLSLLAEREDTLVRLPVRHGELKHFFEDYAHYYYLPDEDIAIHRSVGSFVDAAHRVRATRQTCYVKKECDYVALPVPTPCGRLKRTWDDKATCLELPVDEAELAVALSAYFAALL